jgi:hypothetical protein
MSPRDTSTGGVLEAMILPALKRGGYTFQTQQKITPRPGGRRHFVDVIAEKDGQRYLVSLKWQQVSGTAEQKVPFEVISLADAVKQGEFTKAYLVLGGEGWTLRDFYTDGGLKSHLVDSEKVEIVTLEHFVGIANSGAL